MATKKATKPKAEAPGIYRARTGLNYVRGDGTQVRVEAGQLAEDLPARSIPWLLEQGLIHESEPAPPASAAEPEG